MPTLIQLKTAQAMAAVTLVFGGLQLLATDNTHVARRCSSDATAAHAMSLRRGRAWGVAELKAVSTWITLGGGVDADLRHLAGAGRSVGAIRAHLWHPAYGSRPHVEYAPS